MGDQAVAGLGAGVAVSFLACPTELIKCRIQAQGGAAPAQACCTKEQSQHWHTGNSYHQGPPYRSFCTCLLAPLCLH